MQIENDANKDWWVSLVLNAYDSRTRSSFNFFVDLKSM